MKSRIRLSDNFTYRKLLRFTLPSIIMNIFSSIYIVVDGFFVANFVGKTEFAAVNLIMPVGACGSSGSLCFNPDGGRCVSAYLLRQKE